MGGGKVKFKAVVTGLVFSSMLVFSSGTGVQAAEQVERIYHDDEGTEYSVVSVDFPVNANEGELSTFAFSTYATGTLYTKNPLGFKPSGYAVSETKKSTVHSIRAKVTVNSSGFSAKDSGFKTINNTTMATSETLKADAEKATFISQHGVKTSSSGTWQTATAEKRY